MGIPCGIGIAPTKTLAKLANHVAKKNPVFGGVCDMMDPTIRAVCLPHIAVGEVWGVGKAAVLREHGAHIDAFARKALWDAGLDFDHGTGHGVGSYLGVHEGPQRISPVGSSQAGGDEPLPSPVVATAWNWLLELDEADTTRIDAFARLEADAERKGAVGGVVEVDEPQVAQLDQQHDVGRAFGEPQQPPLALAGQRRREQQ